MARLRTFGFERASLWMLAGNERALRFYRREGWVADGRSKLVTGPGRGRDGPPGYGPAAHGP